MPLNFRDMNLKVGAYYNVETKINPKSRRLAKVVNSNGRLMWLINGFKYDIDYWVTDGVIWNE